MTDDWKDWLRQLNIPSIENRIDELKSRIKLDQQEIVYLSIIRKGIQRAAEFKAISEAKAMQAIDEAVKEANDDVRYAPKPNGEGGIINRWEPKEN